MAETNTSLGGANGAPLDQVLRHGAFERVQPQVVAPILAHVRVRHVAPRTLVNRPDDEQCQLVLGGRLHSYVVLADGRRLLFEIVREGGIDGLLNIVPGLEGHFTEAVRPSVVVSLSRNVLERLIDAEPQVAVNLMRLLLVRLERRETQLESATYHEAIRRIARLLLALSRYLGSPGSAGAAPGMVELRPRPSHQVLGDMLGLRRETITLTIGLLRNAGAVRVERDHLLLVRTALERISGGSSPVLGQAAEGVATLAHQPARDC